MTHHYELTCISESVAREASFCELEEAASLCGLHPEMVEEFLRGHLVRAFQSRGGTILFDHAGISRLRQIAHLREHEQMSLRVIRYIVGLHDALDSREAELRELRERLR
ncbi:MerR family transcriptional regulator [Akkermansiaceae bacterium]|nr:MerR family transcriptional regulator [Akkermansiaceae bacterium]MDA7888919.1 MerR family transcriptional regulator [Akkermansiaceae bacterium]MDB4538009.1 MerR family transcriptional regulator [Akkermansiaceae bacterium]